MISFIKTSTMNVFEFKFIVLAVYSVIIYIFLDYLSICYYCSKYYNWYFQSIKNDSIYDYIVVGAGSAGSIIASRLSNAGQRTLLLEAGGYPPYLSDIPMVAPILQKSEYNWRYTTEPQKDACKALVNQSSIWPMGKILGGTSRLNYMVYVTGHPNDYSSWFPDFSEPSVEKGGPLNIQSLQWSSKLSDILLDGIREMSHSIHDINKVAQPGFMKINVTMKNGKRWSTDKVLNYAETLTVLTNTLVNKILFDGKMANGVEYINFDMKFRAFAKKGVIVSAGAIGSPKLLMLSGIGPKDHLKHHKIKVIKNLPVGENLIDHIITGLDLVTLNVSPFISLIDVINPKFIFNYLLYGKGLWSFSGIEVTGTFYKSSTHNKSLSPDLQVMTMPAGISQDVGIVIRTSLGIQDEIYKQYFAPLENRTTITIAPVLLHPKSTGTVKLKSDNPNDQPLIDPKYLSVKDDVDTLINGIQFVQRLVKTKALQNIGATIYEKHFPGCGNMSFKTYEYWECYIRHLTLTCYHPAGTCKMGEVVDKSFKVFGLHNLYIVDASVFPVLPSGNTNAGVVMLAEKFSQLIIKKLKKEKCTCTCNVLDIFTNI